MSDTPKLMVEKRCVHGALRGESEHKVCGLHYCTHNEAHSLNCPGGERRVPSVPEVVAWLREQGAYPQVLWCGVHSSSAITPGYRCDHAKSLYARQSEVPDCDQTWVLVIPLVGVPEKGNSK